MGNQLRRVRRLEERHKPAYSDGAEFYYDIPDSKTALEMLEIVHECGLWHCFPHWFELLPQELKERYLAEGAAPYLTPTDS